jgi:DNA processing protein
MSATTGRTQPSRTSERTAWIALASTVGVGEVTFQRLVERYGGAWDAMRALAAVPDERADHVLAAATGLPRRSGLARRIREASADPERVERAIARLGGWIATPLDRSYPARLHDLADPPPVLFGLGRRDALDAASLVAVVGTRRPTGLGRDIAARIATRLAVAGVVVVSGLAVGIDAIAHSLAVDAGGLTVGVAGSGLDRPAPRANDRLVRRILDGHGAIVSELAPGVGPTAGTFPRRNRIISVLASATIVVEAPERSGALITARHALEQGRRLLVVPGRPFDPSVAGCLTLLRETPARPVTGLDELIEDLALQVRAALPGAGNEDPDRALAGLSALERAVAGALADGPQTLDRLIATGGHRPGEVAAAVTILQLRGLARAHGSLILAAGALLAARRSATA